MENKKRKLTALEASFVVGALIVIPFFIFFIINLKETKCEYYRKGLQAGLVSAEEHCYEFNKDEYMGSLGWIEKNNPDLFDEIKSGKIEDYGCIGLEQSFLEKFFGI